MEGTVGCIYLVGAGPGEAHYLTDQAQQVLVIAEVVLYDALVAPSILRSLPEHCLKLAVGKRGGGVSTAQEKINQQLIMYCRQGKQVVRLKGGDPFIFGRAAAEMAALRQANCPFIVIPGLSSALTVPLLAGIPLTDQALSRCFAVLSAHEPALVDWNALARLDTLVILMGTRHLGQIIERLLGQGRSPAEPIAVIHQGGRAEQTVWQGTLADIVEQTAGMTLSPAVMVVGQVVKRRDLSPGTIPAGIFNLKAHPLGTPLESSANAMPAAQPLVGQTILVTRAAQQSSSFRQRLEQLGAQVIDVPALAIGPPSSWVALDQAIADLDTFQWLILTSANGVNYFWQRLTQSGQDARALAGVKIAVVGKKTAATLQTHGLNPDFIPPDFVADALVDHFPDTLSKQRILFPRVESGGREILVKTLSAQGADIVEVAAYQSVCPPQLTSAAWEALVTYQVDAITFASSKTVQHFAQLLQAAIPSQSDLTVSNLLAPVKLASIGPQTSKRCREVLGRFDVEAKEYTLDGLAIALCQS